jgi:hypothetical protein
LVAADVNQEYLCSAAASDDNSLKTRVERDSEVAILTVRHPFKFLLSEGADLRGVCDVEDVEAGCPARRGLAHNVEASAVGVEGEIVRTSGPGVKLAAEF